MKNERTHISMPTQRELELFVQKRLDSKRMAEIKALSEESPLLKEAIEGYAMHPVIPQFSAKAQNLIGSAQAIGGIATTVTVASPWWHLSGWILGLTVGGGSAFLIFSNKEVPKEKTPIKQEVVSAPSKERKEESKTVDYPSVSEVEVPQKKSIGGKGELVQPEPIAGIGTSSMESNANVGTIDPIVPSQDTYNLILVREYASAEYPIELNNKPDEEHPLVGQHQILHINNFKIVDYSSFRREEWPTLQELTQHVGANYESQESQEWVEQMHYNGSINYMDFVEQGVYALTIQEYSNALYNFQSLLSLYPDDVNGLFYSGMCLYYQGKYVESRGYFEQVQKSSFRTFSEEGAFYEAMTYLESGDKAIAKGKLEFIGAQRGFYAKRSRDVLKLIE